MWPCCSCASQKIVWANVAALYFFSTTAELIGQLDFSKQPNGKHVTAQEYQSFSTLNELLKEEVEVSRSLLLVLAAWFWSEQKPCYLG